MPSGEPLTFEHRAVVDDAIKHRLGGLGEQVLSDPWFANLYLFRRVHDHRFHTGLRPYISGLAYDGLPYTMPLFDIAALGAVELDAFGAEHRCFFPVAEAEVEHLDPDRFEITSKRDDADYLYEAERFRRYAGRDLAPKRSVVKQLLNAHTVRAEPFVAAHAGAALRILNQWAIDKGKTAQEADVEACTEALQCLVPLGLVARIYIAGDDPAGFLIAQVFDDVAIIRFAKAQDRFKGMYQYMFQEFCMDRPGLKWLNFEQDMGLANFRQTKMSYRPHALIAKYRVRPHA